MPPKTTAIIHPFDLFGSAGASAGAELLADALREMLDDNRRERAPTRGRAYSNHLRIRELAFETPGDYQHWRAAARDVVRDILRRGDFLLWLTGNHLGVLPVLEEVLSHDAQTLIVQLDAHLDIQHFTDSPRDLSHGNFIRHCEPAPQHLVNVGHRDLFLRAREVRRYYRHTFAAAELALDPQPALRALQEASQAAKRVFIDIDCDVLDPAFFPAVSHPLPFGLTPLLLLRFLNGVWSERLCGISISEFDPGRDRQDQSLGLLAWLLEYVLLKRYERPESERS